MDDIIKQLTQRIEALEEHCYEFMTLKEAGVTNALRRFVHLLPPEYYTVNEVAGMMKVHPETIARMCRNAEITSIKFGKVLGISSNDLAEYLRKNQV